jgi:GNAT superfamily N-acetyltransferase
MQIEIRQAVFADIEALAPLLDAYRQFHRQPSDAAAARAFLVDRFDHGESVIFIARDEGGAVGFTQLFPAFSSLALKRTLILNDLYVNESHRRSGVGRMLLAHATAYAREVGAVRMVLTAEATNVKAQALYEATGWRQDPHFRVFYLHLGART